MKRKNYLICLLTAIILLPIGVQAKDKKKGKKNIPMTEIQTTGTQDRAIWVKLLWKISYPVIHNLAEGTLHQNMPIETRSGETAGYKDMTHLEAVGRTLAGVAPWLALPDDDTEEGKLRKQMREEVLKGLKNAVDPASPDLLNFTKHAQPIVDAAYLVHAFLRAPKALWEPLDEVTKERYIKSFQSLRDRTGAYNNWLLFTGLTESFLLGKGVQYDQFRIRVSKNKVKEWYVGGLEMLVAQAVYAAEYFLGRKFEDAPGEVRRITAALRRETLNIALVGMPSCGKSTLGRLLAKQLGRPLVDLDEEIVKADGRSIPDIFAAEGEEGFRAKEAAQIARFGKEKGLVLSCGGGAVKRAENVRALRQNGVVLFIDRPVEALAVGGNRPLSSSAEALRTMEAQRRPLYRAAADAVVPNTGTLEDALRAAMEALDEIFDS